MSDSLARDVQRILLFRKKYVPLPRKLWGYPLLDRKEFGVLPHVFELAFCETYNVDMPVIDGILLEPLLQDMLYESNRGQMLLLTTGKSRFEVAVVVAQKSQVLATRNLPDSILPYVQLMLAAYTQDLLIFLGSEEGQRLIRTGLGAIALHVAVECSQSDIMVALVAAEVRVDARDSYSDTALHRATRREDATMMGFLLGLGHPVDAKNNYQETLSSWSALWNAIIFHRNERIIETLLNHGADPNTKGADGLSELSRTVAHGHEEYLILLLRREVNPSGKAVWSWTSLHWAAHMGYLECAKLLLEAGADVSPVSDQGNTPLDRALEMKRTPYCGALTRCRCENWSRNWNTAFEAVNVRERCENEWSSIFNE